MRHPLRRRPLALLAVLLMAGPLLAGCSDPAPPPDNDARKVLASLQWPVLTVRTTPSEPFEQVRPNHVTWSNGIFAVASENEPDMSRRAVVDGTTSYSTDFGRGWIRQEHPARHAMHNRLALWDLKWVLEQPTMELKVTEVGNVANFTAIGKVGPGWDVHAQLEAVDGQVRWGRLEAQVGRESPYTFLSEGVAFPFPPAVPAEWRSLDEVLTLQDSARSAHTTVILLLKDYARNRGGTMPEEPSASSLAVEMTASGRQWPNNPFTGRPLAVGTASGDIEWQTCGLRDARYGGLGYDSSLVIQSFGAGCRN